MAFFHSTFKDTISSVGNAGLMLPRALTAFVNLILQGRASLPLHPLLFGALLVTLNRRMAG